MADELTQLTESHQFNCCGIDREGDTVYDETNPEPVIVQVFRDGLMRPACRCYENTSKACKASDEDGNTSDRGPCPYVKTPR